MHRISMLRRTVAALFALLISFAMLAGPAQATKVPRVMAALGDFVLIEIGANDACASTPTATATFQGQVRSPARRSSPKRLGARPSPTGATEAAPWRTRGRPL